jgi:hypothetical protein
LLIYRSVSVPLNAPASVLWCYVHEITAPLFAAFSGFAVGQDVVEHITDRLLSRKF